MTTENRRERPSAIRSFNAKLVCECEFAAGRGKAHHWVGACDCGACEIEIHILPTGQTTIIVKEISYGITQRGLSALKSGPKFDPSEPDDLASIQDFYEWAEGEDEEEWEDQDQFYQWMDDNFGADEPHPTDANENLSQ